MHPLTASPRAPHPAPMSERLGFDELKSAVRLPSPKAAALRVIALCRHDGVAMPELAAAIRSDPALAGRIIKIANAVNPNKSRPIASVTGDTLLLVGIHAVRQAAFGMSLIGDPQESPCKGYDYAQFWSQAVAVACAAEAIAETSRIAPPPEMFHCGLMHRIGSLALATLRPQACGELCAQLRDAPRRQVLDVQRDVFGVDEREMLLLVLQDWGIPKVFQEALYHSETPQASGMAPESREQRLVHSLELARLLAQAAMQEGMPVALGARILECGRRLEFAPEQLETFIRQTCDQWAAWGRELGIKTVSYDRQKLSWDPAQAGEPAPPPAVRVEAASHPLRIVLAGADPARRAHAQQCLRAAGHTVSVADNGIAALGLANRQGVQAVIADWLMPGLDGVQLCAELRRTDPARPLYFILLSPFEDERRRMQAFEAGVDAILHPPLNPRLLAARLLAAQRIAALDGQRYG